jgi:hypothetical protein
VWKDLVAGHPREEIVDALAGLDPELAPKAMTLVDHLVERGLMRPSIRAVDAAPLGELGSLAMALTGVREILLESFDDMRDLVVADPIHEVEEEAGWPVRKAAQA